ncbi:MAG: hypothetical protein ACRDBL_04630 [Rhabdaerophilum sp.]
MRDQPDGAGGGNRVLVAIILLILILAWAIGGQAIWSGQPLPVTR